MLDDIIQFFILFFSAAAIWFVGRKESWSRWGYIFGIISQPFWLYATFMDQQWGMFTLSLVFSYSWSQGIYNYWIKAEPVTEPTKLDSTEPS